MRKIWLAGILAHIEKCLCHDPLLGAWTDVADQGNWMATWAFACRYQFRDLVAALELVISSEDLHKSLENGQLYTDDMSAVCIALGAESLSRMLGLVCKDLLELARLSKDKLRYITKAPVNGNGFSTTDVRRRAQAVYDKACSHLPDEEAPAPG